MGMYWRNSRNRRGIPPGNVSPRASSGAKITLGADMAGRANFVRSGKKLFLGKAFVIGYFQAYFSEREIKVSVSLFDCEK